MLYYDAIYPCSTLIVCDIIFFVSILIFPSNRTILAPYEYFRNYGQGTLGTVCPLINFEYLVTVAQEKLYPSLV